MARSVILHVDDLGASHGANAAFFDLVARGRVTCGSVMVPGAWFREIVEAAAHDPRLDVGVHLTLTSEWSTCRWAPISTVSRASGLIDQDGYFWRDLASLRSHLVVEAAELELRSQIERAIAAGLEPTHIDAHMAAAMLPELLDAHVRLAKEFGLMPILPRSITWAPDAAAYNRCVADLDRTGATVIDHCRGTLPVEGHELASRWRAEMAALPDGITHLSLHCTMPGDFGAMSPQHAGWRVDEHAFFAQGGFDLIREELGYGSISTRDLQTRWSTTQT